MSKPKKKSCSQVRKVTHVNIYGAINDGRVIKYSDGASSAEK
jgi:hypothetical protein